MIPLLAIAAAQEVPLEESVRYASLQLDDGLRVFAVHQEQGDRATLVTRIAAGRADEDDPGIAWASGSSWFEGAATPVASVRQVYDAIGADSQVSVDATHTEFVTVVPAEKLSIAMSLEWLRLADPLDGVDETSPIVHEASVDAFNAKYLGPVYEALYPDEPVMRRWVAAPADRHPMYVANAFVARNWLPSRTTLVIASSMEPVEVLCTVHPSGCEQVEEVARDVLTIPDPAFGYERPRSSARRVGPLAAGVDPVLLAAWRLPFRGVAGRFVRDHIEQALNQEVRSRCHTMDAKDEMVLVCVLPADTREDDLLRTFKKGWDTKKLARDVPAFQRDVLFSLRGSSAASDFTQRFARRVSAGKSPSPYTGLRGELAFDADWMEQVLDDLDLRRASFIRLTP